MVQYIILKGKMIMEIGAIVIMAIGASTILGAHVLYTKTILAMHSKICLLSSWVSFSTSMELPCNITPLLVQYTLAPPMIELEILPIYNLKKAIKVPWFKELYLYGWDVHVCYLSLDLCFLIFSKSIFFQSWTCCFFCFKS